MIRLGLRSRFIGAILLTSAVTLAAAAIALLSPLERSLRDGELDSLVGSAQDGKGAFTDITPAELYSGSPALRRAARKVAGPSGGRVLLMTSTGRILYDPAGSAALVSVARRAIVREGTVREVATAGGALVGAVAVRTSIGGQHGTIIALQRSLDDAHSAVGVVQRALVVACAIALVVGLLLGAGLVTRLLRRLRRLRDAVNRVGSHGLDTEIPADFAQDEVADLTHAFRSMQKALRRQEESRKAFVATASHELRTPITSLHGMLELLDQDLSARSPDYDDARLQLAGARRQSVRLVALARDLLDLSRLDAGSALRSEPVELAEVARAVLAEFELRARGAGVTLTPAPGTEPCWGLGDPGSVARIVRILVDNALRYSPSGAAVQIASTVEDGMASIAVSDAGPGVAPQDAERVFERFSRGSGSGSDDDGGFGLGLAIGRELARQMMGELRLETSHTSGACFSLALPRAVVAGDQDEDPPAAEPVEGAAVTD